jgi:hypothetical protein
MSLRTLFERRDPYWEREGPAARREHRRRRIRGLLALAAATAAVAATVFAWSVELGLAGAAGIRLSLPTG